MIIKSTLEKLVNFILHHNKLLKMSVQQHVHISATLPSITNENVSLTFSVLIKHIIRILGVSNRCNMYFS